MQDSVIKGISYCGVGSRETPKDVLDRMANIAGHLARLGMVLRSGGARGADKAFERGCDYVGGKKDIYYIKDATDQCLKIAEEIHPNWKACSPIARNLHARNCLQVLGPDLKSPSMFCVCWTKKGELVGGTRTALVLCERYQIPVINLFFEDHERSLNRWIQSREEEIWPKRTQF